MTFTRNQLSHFRFLGKQNISASTSSAEIGSALGSQTRTIYVFNEAGDTVYVLIGPTGGTATAANGFPIATGTGDYLMTTPGQFVQVILASGSGTVGICEMGT